MKPSEMNNEELDDQLWTLRDLLNDRGIPNASVVEEAATRLRNSIPKPKNIHVVVYDGVNLVIDGYYVCDLHERYARKPEFRREVEKRLRTALKVVEQPSESN